MTDKEIRGGKWYEVAEGKEDEVEETLGYCDVTKVEYLNVTGRVSNCFGI